MFVCSSLQTVVSTEHVSIDLLGTDRDEGALVPVRGRSITHGCGVMSQIGAWVIAK